MPTEYISPGISFPRPFALVIDDMGWIQGSSLGEKTPRGPYRNGVKRVFDLEDYRHVVGIAKAACVRVQGLFILSELDCKNILAKYPTTTFQRDKWDNSSNISKQQEEIVKYVVSQSAHLEFGFHGLGHEHWPEGGEQRRAEWYNLEDDHPWPEDILRQHVTAAKAILDQYGLSPSAGQSFPETFVPGAYSYYWNPNGEFSLGKLMRESGVKYANTNFTVIPELNPPAELNGGGFDHGLHVLGRLNYGNLWYELGSLPKVPVSMQPTDIVETHWANWLASDDFLQPELSRQFSAATINDIPVAAFFEQDDHVYIYLPVLQRQKYTLRYDIGTQYPDFCVFVDGTYNVLEVTNTHQQATLSIEMYGKQDLIVYCDQPSQISSDRENLLIRYSTYEEATRKLTVTLEATNYQGVAGKISVTW